MTVFWVYLDIDIDIYIYVYIKEIYAHWNTMHMYIYIYTGDKYLFPISIQPSSDIIEISSSNTGHKSKELDLTLVLHVVPAALSSLAPPAEMMPNEAQWLNMTCLFVVFCCLRPSKQNDSLLRDCSRSWIKQSYFKYCLKIAFYMNMGIGRWMWSTNMLKQYATARMLQPSRK